MKASGRTYTWSCLESDREVYISDRVAVSPLEDTLTEEYGARGALDMTIEAGELDPREQTRVRYPKECDLDVESERGVKHAEPSAVSFGGSLPTRYLVKVLPGF